MSLYYSFTQDLSRADYFPLLSQQMDTHNAFVRISTDHNAMQIIRHFHGNKSHIRLPGSVMVNKNLLFE